MCAIDFRGCVTVLDALARICPNHPDYLPQEIVIIDCVAGKVLDLDDCLPTDISVVFKKIENDYDTICIPQVQYLA